MGGLVASYYFFPAAVQVTSESGIQLPWVFSSVRKDHSLSLFLVKVWRKGMRPVGEDRSPVQTIFSALKPTLVAESQPPMLLPAARMIRRGGRFSIA